MLLRALWCSLIYHQHSVREVCKYSQYYRQVTAAKAVEADMERERRAAAEEVREGTRLA
jgi:hypothetical protein